jgi:hypothetical protein
VNATLVSESAIALQRGISQGCIMSAIICIRHLDAEHDLKEIVKSFAELVVVRPIFLESLHRSGHICISSIVMS